jgi:hypothetical protein
MNELIKLINDFDEEKISRTEEEDFLLKYGRGKAGHYFRRILDLYYNDDVLPTHYDDETDLVGYTQFIHLWRYITYPLIERGWTKEDLHKEISNMCATYKKIGYTVIPPIVRKGKHRNEK